MANDDLADERMNGQTKYAEPFTRPSKLLETGQRNVMPLNVFVSWPSSPSLLYLALRDGQRRPSLGCTDGASGGTVE